MVVALASSVAAVDAAAEMAAAASRKLEEAHERFRSISFIAALATPLPLLSRGSLVATSSMAEREARLEYLACAVGACMGNRYSLSNSLEVSMPISQT